MKISIFQAGVIAACILLAGVGLFVFSTYSSSSSKSAVGAVTIWGPFPRDAMTQALQSLAAADKDLKSVTYVQMQADTFDQDYVNAVAAGNAPDLVLISQEDLQKLKPTLYEIPFSAISARQFADTFADGASIFEDANGIYGVPFAIDPLVMYFNKTVLASSGIASPPATWEAMTGLVPSVTQQSGQTIGQALIALGTYANVHDARGILSALFFQAGVPVSTPVANGGVRGAITGTASNGITPGQAAVRFYTSFANPAQQSYTWNSSLPDSQQYFVQGKLALYLGYASELSYLQQANPNLSFDVAKIPQPATAASRVDYGKFYAFAIPRTAPNQSGAFAVAVKLSSDAAATALLKAAGTLAPAKKSLLPPTATPTDQYAAIFDDQAIIARGWLSPDPATTDSIFASMIQNVISGRSTLDQAVPAAEQSLTAALQHP